MSALLIFLHIPKTAGTTFAAILDRNFKRSRIVNVYPNFGISSAEFRGLPESALRAAECVKGHFEYGIHRGIGRPFTYVTFVRDPVEQVRSRYNHMRTSRSHPLHYLARQGASLEDFVRISPDNYQTRTLAGIEPAPGQGHPPLTERDLARVKENVGRHFALVGIAERFDESLVLARRRLGLERIVYVSRNVRRRRQRDVPLSDSARQLVEDHARFDLALYDWAITRLEQTIVGEGEAFESELRAFREANARYRRIMGPIDALSHRAVRGTRQARFLYRRIRRGR